MRRRMLFVIAATAVAALAVPAVPAVAGGGGCHGDATAGAGDTVEIADGCFGPTTLKVDPGDTVTFVNLDPYAHNVSAVTWGHLNDLNQGDSFQTTFAEAGVYPFACQYHPGMVGAIVVGNGKALAGEAPVVSETVASNQGIGYLMMSAGSSMRMPLVFAGLAVIGVMAMAMYELFAVLERRMTRWAHRGDLS